MILGAVPPTGSLIAGEIAINHADKKLYAKHPSTGAIQEIGSLSAHSHDELYSANSTQHLELQNNGDLVVTAGSTSKTLTLPGASGTLATLDDITAGGGGVSTINDLDELFNSARATYYHEVGYTAGGDVSAIEVYATSAKATHLYSRAFTYTSGNIAQVLTTDRQNSGVSLTKTISYNGSGDIATVTRSYSL